MMPSIRVDPEVFARLLAIKHEIETEEQASATMNDATHEAIRRARANQRPPCLCRVCGDEIWWAGMTGEYRYLHVNKLNPGHEGLPI